MICYERNRSFLERGGEESGKEEAGVYCRERVGDPIKPRWIRESWYRCNGYPLRKPLARWEDRGLRGTGSR